MRFSLITLSLALSSGLAAQYDVTAFMSTYVPVTEGIDAGVGPMWDDPEVTVPIGFNFNVNGATINTLTTFNLGDALIAPDGNGTYVGLWPLTIDVADLANASENLSSVMQYATTGVAPERVFTFEWTNTGFYNEVFDGIWASQANWQVVLYEADGAIEFRFGPNTVTDINLLSDGFLSTGLFSGVNLDMPSGQFLFGTGPASAPVFAEYTDFYTLYYGGTVLEGMPEDGQVYRFTPSNVGVEEAAAAAWSLYPNPAHGDVYTSVGGLQALDAQGREVARQAVGERRFDVSGWPAGVYFLTDGVHTQRLMVQ